MKRNIFFYLIICLSTLPLLAQEEGDVLSKNFKFKDGVYYSFEQFQSNQPAISWDSVQASLYTNPQTFSTKVEYIKKQKEALSLKELWGVCLGGIPYIRLPKDSASQVLTYFAGLQLRGKICYFDYEKTVKRPISMAAYNPLTGLPFRKAIIQRKETLKYGAILEFETGNIKLFTLENFLAWIQDDPKLVQTVKKIPPEELQEKLFKCLLIYDDRNEVRIKTKKSSFNSID